MKQIVLIGFMGAGKTSIGKKLSKKLGWQFIDTDDLIEEQAHMAIGDIFAEHGETYFRDLETLTLKQLLCVEQPAVISVGGGLPLREINRTLLRQMGEVIYLRAQVKSLLYRLQGDSKRPKLQGGDLKEKIEQLLEEREEIYKEVADLIVDTDKKSINKVVDEIAEYVG